MRRGQDDISNQPNNIQVVILANAYRPRRPLQAWPCAVLLLLCGAVFAKPPRATVTQPFDGVTFTQELRDDPPLRLYWVQVDLDNPRIHLRVCRGGAAPTGLGDWETTLLPVSKIAQREHLDVAVNGNYFAPKDTKILFGTMIPYFDGNPAKCVGWTVCDGQILSLHPLGLDFSTLVINRGGRAFIRRLVAPPAGAWGAVSGIAVLQDGRNVGSDLAPAPRTAVGLDSDAKQLTLFTVDGRRPGYSMGLSLKQLADEMRKLGCTSAISLDGGGSSTLVIRRHQYWAPVNTPSDGHQLAVPLCIERPVADALGIVVDPPPGQPAAK